MLKVLQILKTECLMLIQKIDNALVLYSIIDSEKACIQGRALPFDANDVVSDRI
jgi:hypothetical protein